ncbi:predicted protein [Lichtheimia corymbifera JMRC:FSU:9682]|uniref:Uncharacterized protein n=1 Tax=Lichtheimia corymbifera JMRC:FSU:9682 TaxID=1263082 RepID=A0A068RNS2_9FUNG|nr:predicted protein [Lichtheimia corymbifera JMRC:FSU:9682]
MKSRVLVSLFLLIVCFQSTIVIGVFGDWKSDRACFGGYCNKGGPLSPLPADKCTEAIQPKSNPECSGGRVSKWYTAGAGQFCMCGRQEASNSIPELEKCAQQVEDVIRSYDPKKLELPGYEKLYEMEHPGELQKQKDIYDKFQAYKKAHSEDQNGSKFLTSPESPCESQRSAAVAACEKCPACKYFE